MKRKSIKRKFRISFIVLICLLSFSSSLTLAGIPVTCVNCSNLFTQALEYIKDIEQLAEAIKRYEELVKQTQNALTNTMNLPASMKSKLEYQLRGALANIRRLKTYKADMDALYTIFTETWPELRDVKVDGVLMSDRIDDRRNQFNIAAVKMDNILQSNFQLSGQQLQDLEDSGEFDTYISGLLSSKSGRMQAIEAGNQINALTVNELRQTRALLANYVQAQSSETAQKQHEQKLREAEDQRERSVGINRGSVVLPEP
ncbi:P-type conjugative transfer protein TrbJ [Desulfobacter curvatus]|uniref:P-type conjugative transfer protein TrbJ n=1 Tax=Desulfobacter curvatus TaxID=2290 RepID=UPI00035E6683|nr:P-type conjugative transfer protein TrbJ [Desulfobacter curvatus]